MYTPSEAGFCDVFGNVWEWVEDHFNGFEDFKSHHLYADFSTPTFDGRHNVIMVCTSCNFVINFFFVLKLKKTALHNKSSRPVNAAWSL